MTTLQNITKLPFLFSLINPEKEKIFPYLSSYLQYTPAEKLYTKDNIKDLITKEKLYHDAIINSPQYKMTQLKAWSNYIKWICNIIPEIYNEQMRTFLVLENYTKTMVDEKIYYNNKEYISFWVYYIDMCRDDIDILKYMMKNNICTHNYFLYESIAIIYEKYHDFENANQAYLKGFEVKVDNIEGLQNKYKQFEIRMENRINREISGTSLNYDTIDKYLHNELEKSNTPTYNNYNKRNLTSNNMNYVTLKFQITRNKIKIFNDEKDQQQGKSTINSKETVNYGEIPVFVDEPFRNNLVTKGTQLVIIYKLLVKYLLDKDLSFQKANEIFLQKLNAEYEKKPYSWLSQNRLFILNDLSNNIQNEKEIEINKASKSITQDNCSDEAQRINKNKENIPISTLTVDDVVNKIETQIKESKNLQKEENKAETQNIVKVVLPNPTKNKKEIISARIKYINNNDKNEIYLLDKRIEYYRNKLKQERQIKAEKQKEIEQLKLPTEELDKDDDNVDSDGDLNMDSDNEENEQKNENRFNLNYIQPLQKSPPNKNNSQNLLQQIKPLDINMINKKTSNNVIDNSKQQNQNLFNKTMTEEEINEKMNEIEDKYQKKIISLETRDKLLSFIEEKISQLEKKQNKGNQDLLDNYLAPAESQKCKNIFIENGINQGNAHINNIKPISTNFLITPDKKNNDFSLSFDSTHSHLFAKSLLNQNNINQKQNNFLNNFLPDSKDNNINDNNYFNSPNSKLSSFLDGMNNDNKQNVDLGKYFNVNSNSHKYNNDLNNSRLAKIFMEDDNFFESAGKNIYNMIKNNNDDNSASITNNNPRKNCMSSITEKTIENTRNSSDLSIEKLFKS